MSGEFPKAETKPKSALHELLKEHQAHSNMCSPPATSLEAIGPRDHFEFYAAHHTAVLELRVPQSASSLMESNLSSDVEPFLLDTSISC